MNRFVDIAPAAAADLIEIHAYIAKDRPRAANRFLTAAHRGFEMLADMPGIGRERVSADPKLKDVRSWPIRGFRNFLVFYRPTEAGIEVMRVVHGARDLRGRFGA
jgi:toxin ParE1/3/4